ncbi:MAG: DNA polymerase III subunit delta [Deltaproteobacteria bacterium]|nr:DNA polymerase III subunit delta [Deltaproteobacteria bacterium]
MQIPIQRILSGEIMPIYVLVGEETLIADEILSALKAKLFPEGGEDLNTEVFYAPETSPYQIIEGAATLPMFAQKRLIIVRDVDRYSAEELKRFLPYLEEPASSSVLVLLALKLAGNTVFARAVSKRNYVLSCEHPSERQLGGWLEYFARKRGKKMTAEAVFCLKAAIGNDLQRLAHEVEKVSLFVGDSEEIALEDVEKLVVTVREHLIFELTDAIGRKDIPAALELVRSIVEAGEHELVVFSMIVRQLRLMLMTASLLSQGKSRSELAQRLGVPPFVSQKLVRQVEGRSVERLASLYAPLFEAERLLKSSSLPSLFVLERLVAILAQA